MRKNLIIFGFILLIAGMVFGFYASQRNCLIVLITRGYMSLWTDSGSPSHWVDNTAVGNLEEL